MSRILTLLLIVILLFSVNLVITNQITADYTATGRTAIYVVVSDETPEHVQLQADYITDGNTDDIEIQEAIDEVLALGYGTVKAIGEFYFSDTITCTGYPDNVNLDFSDAVLYYSGTGTAFDLNTHKCNIDLGKIVATGSAITSSSAVGLDFYCYWTGLSVNIENFQAGKGMVISGDSNCNTFNYLKFWNCKTGLYCNTTGSFNNFDTFDYRNAVNNNSIAIELGSSGYFGSNVFNRLNADWYNDLSGVTLLKSTNLSYSMTINSIAIETDSTGITHFFDLTHVTYKGCIQVGTLHSSNTGGGKNICTGNGVNITHNIGGPNLVDYVYNPSSASDFAAYNCTKSISTSITNISDYSLRLSSPSLAVDTQVMVTGEELHLLAGSKVDGGLSMYCTNANVLVRCWINSYDKNNNQLQGVTIGYFQANQTNTWFRVDMASEQCAISQNADRSYLQVTIYKDTVASNTEIYLSEFTLYAKSSY